MREATTVEGHAVRALYLTTGAADVYLETGDAALRQTLTRQWDDMVEGKLYLTGGVGARHLAESFGHPYELPSDLAYSETCGAIASLMWSWRMLLATGQARYADLIERTLYNAILGRRVAGWRGVLLREPAGQQRRGGAPPPRRPAAQAVAPGGVLPAQRDASARLARSLRRHARRLGPADPPVRRRPHADRRGSRCTMETAYPWEGRVRLTVEEASAAPLTLALRVPGWCTGASVRVNDRGRQRGRWRPALLATRARVVTRRRRRARSADAGALRGGAPVDRVHARLRGHRARTARLLPRAGRPSGCAPG